MKELPKGGGNWRNWRSTILSVKEDESNRLRRGSEAMQFTDNENAPSPLLFLQPTPCTVPPHLVAPSPLALGMESAPRLARLKVRPWASLGMLQEVPYENRTHS